MRKQCCRFTIRAHGPRHLVARLGGIFLVVTLFVNALTVGCSGSGPGTEQTGWAELRSRADQGDVSSQRELGRAFRDGTRVQRDYGQASKWFRKAADQGDAVAQMGLGDLYEHGKGLPEDGPAAVVWYRLAAEQGHVPALYALGRMYAEGHGVSREAVQTYKWLHLAETLAINSETASFISRERDGVGKQMAPSERAEARLLAREWLEEFIRAKRPSG